MRRRHSSNAIFLLILLMIGVVLAGYVSLRDAHASAATTARLVGRTTRFPIAVELSVLPVVQQAMVNADSAVIDGLIQEGKAFTVANNRQVQIQVVSSAGLEVRVLEGSQAGRTGWVASRFVQLQGRETTRPSAH
jgi:hypothetical protein